VRHRPPSISSSGPGRTFPRLSLQPRRLGSPEAGVRPTRIRAAWPTATRMRVKARRARRSQT
jgi:hypothetical protein